MSRCMDTPDSLFLCPLNYNGGSRIGKEKPRNGGRLELTLANEFVAFERGGDLVGRRMLFQGLLD